MFAAQTHQSSCHEQLPNKRLWLKGLGGVGFLLPTIPVTKCPVPDFHPRRSSAWVRCSRTVSRLTRFRWGPCDDGTQTPQLPLFPSTSLPPSLPARYALQMLVGTSSRNVDERSTQDNKTHLKSLFRIRCDYTKAGSTGALKALLFGD